jgi:hypothetical protein
MKPITVAISILPTATTHIWANGLNQNIAFLVMLLQRIPFVGKTYLLNCGNVDELPPTLSFEGVPAALVKPKDITHEVDLVIEMGGALPVEWVRHVRALGVKVVSLLVGNSYSAQAELPMFGRDATAFTVTPVDEIWTLPQHMKTSAPMLRTVSRAPVLEVPHIWSPFFLDKQIAAVTAAGQRFGFDPARRVGAPWRLAIFEPNISVVKSSFIPMLVADAAYRRERDAVGLMMVMNSFQMKDHPTFNRLATHLDLTRDSKASYEPRVAFAECMASASMDAVVTHQWENALNYLFYDALHGGYPLVHNSEMLKDRGVGFYYPHFDAGLGGEALLQAWRQPPDFWDDYRTRAAAFLATVSPEHEENIRAYASRMTALLEARHAAA